MNKILPFILLLQVFSITVSFSQTGKITGKIIDAKTNETLPGAIVILEGTTQGTTSDMDGIYTINLIKPGKYNVVCKYASYADKRILNIDIQANETFTLNFSLEEPKADTLKEITITARLNRESAVTLVNAQKNSASVSDGVSAEIIKKTPDRNTSDVLKRVSGASIQDNKYAIIRGLNDRYNTTYLNGAPLPSSESDRKAFSFDIFPANMLDNLVINKTATPDMPAEFGGGIIQINTKNIPDKNFQSISVGGAYNTITTGKQQLYYLGGKKDWIGIDDGTRAMPSEIPEQKDFPTLPAKQAELAKAYKNDWGIYSKKFTPNFNLQYSIGQTIKRKQKDFIGMIVALTYNRNYNFQETRRRAYTSNSELTIPSQLDYNYTDKNYSTQTLAGALTNFSVKLNENNSISFKNLASVNADDRVIIREGTPTPLEANPLFLTSTAQWFTSNKIYTGQLIGDHLFEKKKIKINWVGSYSSVLRVIPNLRRNIYTRYTTFNDPIDPVLTDTVPTAAVSTANVGPDYAGGRFYSQNKENIYSFKGDVSYPFEIGKNFKNEIKIGGSYQKRNREFFARQLGYTKYSSAGGSIYFSDSLLHLPQDQIFAPQNMGVIAPNTGGFKLKDATKPTDSYTANSELTAAYFMMDNRYKSWFRLIWGARMESFVMHLNTTLNNKQPFHLETTQVNVFPGLFSERNKSRVPHFRTTQLDVLPSVNAIFSLNEKQNIRACYSQTVNRPEFRELAPFAFYDFNTQFVYSGNDSLKRALIHNYDVRYEIYPERGQLFSVSGFYKKFINPIEQISRADVANEVSFKNVPSATNRGIELEFRVILGALFKNNIKKADSLKSTFAKMLDNLTLFSNFAYIQSSVDISTQIGAASKTRSLQGQSPYIFNAGLMYNDTKNGFSLSTVVNRVGQRIAIVGNINEPDIWENGRTVLDIQLGKTLIKNKLDLKFNVRDAFAQKLYFFQDRNGNKKLDEEVDDLIWISKFGRTYSFTISYRF